ncbi:MAG: TIGR00282 family metallophosphoesterase [Planctomycetes bacterium]|nr:TIGR00282 family metallophosphoesterase [Planctomycetota bacterium]
MVLNLLCVGDVVGAPGRQALRDGLTALVPQRGIECVVVNAENAASGSGLTPALYDKIVAAGAHLITLGDHLYRRREVIPLLETSERIVRPANLPATAPGREFAVHQTPSGHRVAVISLLGRMFMRMQANCPFAAVDRLLRTLPSDIKIIVVDVHAEATSEKVAMGWHLDGRVSVVFGTHTHIPTADERILPKGTAYITDVGMTGPYDSVLGRDKARVIGSMMTSVPCKFDVATDDARMNGVLVAVDTATGKAASVERVRFNGTSARTVSA